MAKLFDNYIAVDWSAKNTPSPAKPCADALWVGEKDDNGMQKESYFRTRTACMAYLKETLSKNIQAKKRTIIGFDLDFGFPAGFVESLHLEADSKLANWQKLWATLTAMITDNEANKNNRFAVANDLNARCVPDNLTYGPLWGHPFKDTYKSLYYKSPGYPYLTKSGHTLRKLRWTEMKEPKAQPSWKLLGTASVGGQALIGIPAIYNLRFSPELEKYSKIWPFETGFAAPIVAKGFTQVLLVEIWPGILRARLDKTIAIKDQAQVKATVDWMQELDEKSGLGTLLKAPSWLTAEAQQDCVNDEGWVLGSGENDKTLRLL